MQTTDSPTSFTHYFLYKGKYLHFRGSGVESGGMTALVSLYTDEGFVFGADGRSLDPGGAVTRDDVQKIFGCQSANIRALFGWSGFPILTTRKGDFDFRLNTLQVAGNVEDQEFSDLFDYAKHIAEALYARLVLCTKKRPLALSPDCKELARMAMVGYVDGKPQCVQMAFPVNKGVLDLPCRNEAHDPPAPIFHVSGCRSGEKVFESMVKAKKMQPCQTTAQGLSLVERYIQLCANEPTIGINTIGGHIHIAALTPIDSKWLIAPKP